MVEKSKATEDWDEKLMFSVRLESHLLEDSSH